MGFSPDHAFARAALRLPPLHLDQESPPPTATASGSCQLPDIRRLFPDVSFESFGRVENPRCLETDGTLTASSLHAPNIGSQHSGAASPAQPVIPNDLAANSSYTQSISPLPTLPQQSPSSQAGNSAVDDLPLTSVAPFDSTGAPGCSFDVLRPNPYMASLEHIASSSTRWKSIPRVPSESSLTRHNHHFHSDTYDDDPSRHQHAGFYHHAERRDRNPYPGTSSWKRAPIPTSHFDHVTPDQMRAARAQAEFEYEISLSNTRRKRPHSLPNIKSLIMTEGLTYSTMPSTSTSAASNDFEISTPISPVSDDEIERVDEEKSKRPCDIERNHVCPRCGRAFNRPSSLRMHGRTHTGFRPFVCPVEWCAQTFTVSSNLRRHCRKHGVEAELPEQSQGL